MTDYRFQPKGLRSDLGWYNRGYIPHFEGGQIPQFFTFRLYDSLPASVIEQWRNEFPAIDEQGKSGFAKTWSAIWIGAMVVASYEMSASPTLFRTVYSSTTTRNTASPLG